MKCDNLQRYSFDVDYEERVVSIEDDKGAYVLAIDADEAIAELKARIQELEKENESLKYSVAALDTDLAMATRWRKVSEEFPTADEGYFWVMWEDGLPDVGYIAAEDDVIETLRDRGEGHSVEWWMPKAPEVK